MTDVDPELAALRAENDLLRSEIIALSLAEERFRALFEHSADAHLIFDETGIIDCNSAALTMLRCDDPSHLRRLHPASLSPEYQPDGRRSMDKSVDMDQMARTQGVHRFEWMHRRMDGEEFLVEVTLTPVRLPHGPVLLVVWHELTERRTREAELRRRLEQLDRQQQVIRRLSTPIIAVAPGVLLVPIVGALDRERAVAMTAAVLAAIAERRARTVIVDLTGADDLVADTISELVRTATASALLGAEVVHAGISPSLARALVELGTSLPNLRTTRTAEQAIAEALHLPSI